MKPTKILIVEDDLFLRELYTDILSSEEWTVDSAADGQEGLEKMQAGGWTLVLLDMNLPKFNGVEIVKKLQAETSKKNNQMIIFLTNMEEGPALKEIESMGYSYLIKSQYAPDQFLEKIKNIVNSITSTL